MSGLVLSSLKPEEMTWELASRLFLLRCRAQNLSPATQELYGYTLEGFRRFLGVSGEPKPSEIQAHHVRGYLDFCKAKLSPETVDARLRQLRTLFRFLVRDGLIFKDPTEAVERPKRERKLARGFTLDQVRATLEKISSRTPMGLRDRALVLLLLDSGLRISEALSLRIGDLDMANGTVVVMGKGSKERKVCWGETVRRAIMAWLRVRTTAKDSDPLFIGRMGDRLDRHQFAKRLKRYTRAAGVEGARLSCHALRHAFALEFLRGGGDVMTLQRLLGHSTLEMTRRYLNQTDDDVMLKARSVGAVVDKMGPLPGERRQVKLR